MQQLLLIVVLFFGITQKAYANVTGSALQNFNPNTSGLEFVTVNPSATLAPWQFNFGSYLTFATNSLPYSTLSLAPNGQDFTEPKDSILYSDVHFGLGLMKGWDFGLSAGFINSQSFQESVYLFTYGDTGINDINLNTKVRLLNGETLGFAVMTSVHFDLIKQNPFVGNDAGPTTNLEMIADVRITPRFIWAVNFGYRIRIDGTPIQNTGVTPLPSQFIYSSALSYHIDDAGSAIIGELYGSFPTMEYTMPTDRQLSNLEGIIGYRHRAWESVDFHGGIGSGIYRGIGSPDLRAYIGINWRLGSSSESIAPPPETEATPTAVESTTSDVLDADTDGVPDAMDKCPNTWTQNYVDADGCNTDQKKSTTDVQLPDGDNDGVPDKDDRCPNTPVGASVNIFGCDVRPYGI